MYKTLMRLKDRIGHADWLKMVEQAKEKGKLTETEYKALLRTVESNDEA